MDRERNGGGMGEGKGQMSEWRKKLINGIRD